MKNEPVVQNDDQGLTDPERRKFFKRAAVGGGAALAVGMGAYGAGKASVEGRLDNEWPVLADDFKPMDGRNTMWAYGLSPHMVARHPERNKQFGTLVKNNPEYCFQAKVTTFEELGWDNNKPGFTQLDNALQHASWFPPMMHELRVGGAGEPNTLFYSWDQSGVEHEKYEFSSKKEASDAIRTAARVFGAVRCGIAKRDERWDYQPIFKSGISGDVMKELSKMPKPPKGSDPKVFEDHHKGLLQMLPKMLPALEQQGVVPEELSWEKDFPFEPKTVIVLAVPMDYDNMATAPSRTSTATVGDGYTKMATLASSVAKFIQGLGYNAVASGNDLGNSVAYGIAAGLGEGGRNNQLLVPGYGPRVRLCKVYTDFEFVEYDQARNWGITDFCKSCKKCGEACPSDAIDMSDDTHFYFDGEHSDKEGYAWSNHQGVKKFHTDAKKCFDYWLESDTDCAACAAACTFNEPDFWHHWFIMAINPISPGFLHASMAELHPAFGYGSTQNPEKVKKFWRTGEGMRVNMKNKSVFGGSNIS